MKKTNLKSILTRIYNNILYLKSSIFIWFIVFSFLYSFQVQAEGIISDEEVETVVKKLATPIILAAGVNPEEINFYIVFLDASCSKLRRRECTLSVS